MLASLVLVTLASSSCGSVSNVKNYDACCSPFDKPTAFAIYDYSYDDVYKVYAQEEIGNISLDQLRAETIDSAEAFAAEQGKSIRVLGYQDHEGGPILLSSDPRSKVEIVFVLTNVDVFQPTPRRIGKSPVLMDVE